MISNEKFFRIDKVVDKMIKDNNKYYTPEIEEFHIGFEYEFNVGNTTWTKFIFDLDRPDKVLENFKLNPQLFRVKYLDKEDIESLGFVHIGGSLLKDNIGVKFVCKSNKNYFIHLSYTKFSDRIVLRIETSIEEDSERTLVCHSIRCNNISQFKKLLNKQLNIIK